MKRQRFDDLIFELANLGFECFEDLPQSTRHRLVRMYFQDYGEWSDAFFDDMTACLNAFEENDLAAFGRLVSSRMDAYVRPFIDKQIKYQAMCKREREEDAA